MKKLRLLALLLGGLTLLCLLPADSFSQNFTAAVQELPVTSGKAQASYKALIEVMNELKVKRGIYFMFNGKKMKDKLVNGQFSASDSVEVVLSQLLKPVGLTFKKVGNIYIILEENDKEISKEVKKKVSKAEEGQSSKEEYEPKTIDFGISSPAVKAITITGKVTTDTEEGLPGVNVLLKGTTTGTSTNAEGNYSITVPEGNENGTLVFSSIGYASEEVPINNRSIINLSLIPDIKSLSEVVVIGYGTQKQKEVTGATTSVTAREITSIAVTGLDQALQGRAAGVQVTQNSGEPGGSVSIRVRGVGSINSTNEPLYVVDGVPFTSLNAINPNDIERIDVLKDAASSAIYGSRASNGVVLITTKRAKAGKTTVTLDAYAGVQMAAKKLDVLDGRDFARLANENLVNSGIAPNPAWSSPETVKGYDWQSAVMQTAPIQNYSVSISGGGEKSRTLFSAGYFQQGGIIIGSDYQRYTARLNSDYDLSSKFKVGVTLNASIDEKKTVASQDGFGGILTNATRIQPTQPITTDQNGFFSVNTDGSINPNGNEFFGWEGYTFASKFGNVNYSTGFGNPVHIIKTDYIKNPRKTQQFLGAVFAEYEFIPGLKFRSTLNLTFGNSFTTNSLRRAPQEINLLSQYRSLSTHSEFSDKSDQWNWINTVSYTKSLGKHNFSAIAGTDALKNNYRFTNISTADLPDAQQVINASDIKSRLVTGYPSSFSLVSYIGRITYDFAGKYLLTANIRRDGSSKFGPNNKYGVFPSASVGWRLSEEGFMKSVPFISELKVRASYGTVGNQNIPDFKYLSTFSNDGGHYQYVLAGENAVPAIYADNVGDPNIRWEKSTQVNIGLDVSLLQDKFTFTTDYYVKKLDDLLGNFPVPSYAGVYGNTILRNGFSMENRGLELALGYNQRFGELNFSANANFSTIDNKITGLTGDDKGYVAQSISVGGGSINDGGAQTRTQVGERIGNFYGYITDGIFQNQGEVDNGGMGGVSPGDRRYKDLNGDGKITPDDKTVIGNGLPKYIYGLTLKADFKRFDLSILLNGQSGVQIANTNRFYLYHMRFYNSTGIQNGSADLLNSWTGEGTSNDLPRNAYNTPTSNRWFSSFYIENGAFLRVRNVQLGYTFAQNWTGKLGISRARLYIAAQNLHTFTKYTGYDPEIGSPNQNVLTTGTDFGRYPLARIFMGGFNLEF